MQPDASHSPVALHVLPGLHVSAPPVPQEPSASNRVIASTTAALWSPAWAQYEIDSWSVVIAKHSVQFAGSSRPVP